jgi:tRNA threonylcarbamoyladenosine biosynthesis protein TsaB
MILAIDTATEHASLALYGPDGIYAEEAWYAGRKHTVELTPRLARMLNLAELKVADLMALAVSLGPGSFTGLRIGLSLAKGLALPHKLPVIGVPTLEVVAYPLRDSLLPVWAVAQAGRGRILTACYGQGEEATWQLLVEPQLTTLEALAKQIDQPALCTGEIDQKAIQILERNSGHKAQAVSPATRLRRASFLAELAAARLEAGAQDDPDALVPLYPSPS